MNTASPRRPASTSHTTSSMLSSFGIPYRSARVTRRRPAARSSVGTLMRPRLRSTKRSGSPTGCDTQDVLEFGTRNAELVGECVEVVAGPEATEDVADPCTAAAEDRLPEGPRRVDDHLGALVGGQPQESGIAIRRVIDAL